MSSTQSATDWIESLSPWPEDGFGLERMRSLLVALGDPQERFPAVHVVGTNGKSTTTRMTEALLLDSGLSVGAYLSPHVRGWSERIRIGGAEADFEAMVAAVRTQSEALGATQFEALTAAALVAFAEAGVDAAVVEAGLGGRHDATNVLRTRIVVLTNVALDHMDVLGDTREQIAAEKLAVVRPGSTVVLGGRHDATNVLRTRIVVLTNVALDHMDVLGDTREQIAAEKLAVVRPGSTVVLGDAEWRGLAEENGAAVVITAGSSNLALAVAAAESFLGRPVDPHAAEQVALPGRLERRGEHPLELWDGAHNLAALGYLLPRLPDREYVLVCSIVRDKRPALMLEALSVLGNTLVATESSNARSLPAAELGELAGNRFAHVETVHDAAAARSRALELAGPDGAVLVTGSLYLLAELSDRSDPS